MERVRAAVTGRRPDRPPFCFWHHFRPRGSAANLAHATLDFFGDFDLDIYKIMPDIPYPFPSGSIKTADDWRLISPLDPSSGNLGAMVDCVRLVRRQLSDRAPILLTMFSPFTYAARFAGVDNIRDQLEQNPTELHAGLAVLAANLARFARASIDAGADGIFFACQGGADSLLSRAEYGEFARPYDIQVLQAAQHGWLTTLHAHGNADLFTDDFARYPAAVLSWSDRITGVSLLEMRRKALSAVLMGGIRENGAILAGDRDALRAEMRDAIEQTGGEKFILANGCSVPDDIPPANLRMARDLVDRL